jgi:hypothetical protein
VIIASKVINIAEWPPWTLWLFAVVGVSIMFGVVLWILPPPLRRKYPLIAFVAIVPLGVQAILSRDSRGWLWMFGLLGIAFLPLLAMGQMPADMPSARDPAVRRHPQYAAVARRGRIAGIGLIVLLAALIVLSGLFVGGL